MDEADADEAAEGSDKTVAVTKTGAGTETEGDGTQSNKAPSPTKKGWLHYFFLRDSVRGFPGRSVPRQRLTQPAYRWSAVMGTCHPDCQGTGIVEGTASN